MRVYTDAQLEGKSHEEFQKLLDQVKTSSELTPDEKDANIEKLESYMQGRKLEGAIIKDMIAGQADIDDLVD